MNENWFTNEPKRRIRRLIRIISKYLFFMKTWDEAKKAFLGDHVTNRLTFPDQTLRSFNYIEEALKKNFPRLLDGSLLFEKLSESELMDLYAQLKGRRINRHDKIVIKRLYKFSTP